MARFVVPASAHALGVADTNTQEAIGKLPCMRVHNVTSKCKEASVREVVCCHMDTLKQAMIHWDGVAIYCTDSDFITALPSNP